MKNDNLVFRATQRLAQQGCWIFTLPVLRGIYLQKCPTRKPEDTPALMKAADDEIERLYASGDLVRVSSDLVVCPSSTAFPKFVLEALLDHILPWTFNYVSLESILHECGEIEEAPPALTVVTTAASDFLRTPYGDIELVHIRAKPQSMVESVFYYTEQQANRATLDQAQKDLAALRISKNRA